MHLFSYLYIVVGLIHSHLIKVMKSKVYLLLQKLEIQSVFPIDSLSSIETQNLLGFDIITTGTGTAGDTTTLISGTHIITGTHMDTGITGMIIGIGLIVLLLGHLLDRRLSRNLDQDLDQIHLKNQDQENQDQE